MAQNTTHLIGLEGQYETRHCHSEQCNGVLTIHFVGVQHQVVELASGSIDWKLEYDDCCECHYTVTTTINKVITKKDKA
jgi:hypothetical protein